LIELPLSSFLILHSVSSFFNFQINYRSPYIFHPKVSIFYLQRQGMVTMKKSLNALKRVLIVDDDQDIRLALRALLRDAGYEVVGEAADGGKAIQLMEKHVPSIVLLDITMPNSNGLDVLVDIKKEYPLTQIVMISGDATSEYVTTALERGAAGFIVKPFNFNNVIKNIERALAEVILATRKANSEAPAEDQAGILNPPALDKDNETPQKT